MNDKKIDNRDVKQSLSLGPFQKEKNEKRKTPIPSGPPYQPKEREGVNKRRSSVISDNSLI